MMQIPLWLQILSAGTSIGVLGALIGTPVVWMLAKRSVRKERENREAR